MTLAESIERKLLSYSWPGNVRELENCIERAVSLARKGELTSDDLPDKIRAPDAEYELPPKDEHEPDVLPLVELERRHIVRAMRLVNGNKARAAELLGIDRSTLYRRLRWYGIRATN